MSELAGWTPVEMKKNKPATPRRPWHFTGGARGAVKAAASQ
jgi:hypothetical protein